MLDRVSFKNFKSLKSVDIDLAPLTVLVGANGSGKSSVITGIHLLSQTGLRRLVEASPEGRKNPWRRFDVIFGGPRDPRRLASPGRPTTLELAMREAGGDELSLAISVPEPKEDATELSYAVRLRGPDGAEERSSSSDSAERDSGALLDHPRVRRFTSAVYLHLDASMMTRVSVVEQEEPRMAADGEGLASTLAWMAGAEPDTLAAITEELAQIVPGVRRILTRRERVTDRTIEKVEIDGQPIWRPVDRARLGDRFSVQFDDGSTIPADLLSEGTVLALGLLTKLREPNRPRLVLLDDIDRGLHIAAQAKLLATLRSLMRQQSDLQIVCTTHSTYLLNLFDAAEVRVLALDAERATRAAPLTAHPEFDKWRYGTQTGELWAALGEAWVVAPNSEAAP